MRQMKLTKLRERHNMLKLVGLVVCVAALSHGAPEPRINCQVQNMSFLI